MTKKEQNKLFKSFAEHFKSLKETEIRKRQSLVEQQISRAFEQRNDEALLWLRIQETALMQEMMSRC